MVRNKELRSYQQLQEFGKGQKETGDTGPYVLPASQNPCWESILLDACTTRKDSESE